VLIQAELFPYEDAGVEKYRYVAVLDGRTSEICRDLDGQVFPVKERRVGVNMHPMHPWCRSSTEPVLSSDTRAMEKRWACDPVTGEEMKVSADMTYRQWEKQMEEMRALNSSTRKFIMKAKNSELPSGFPLRGKPSTIVDKTDDDGKTLQRRVYGSDGKAKIDFDTSDHNQPKAHPSGAHKHVFDYEKKNPRGKPKPLSERELKENTDIIQKGVNYHDKE